MADPGSANHADRLRRRGCCIKDAEKAIAVVLQHHELITAWLVFAIASDVCDAPEPGHTR